jgi:hypothetical protein
MAFIFHIWDNPPTIDELIFFKMVKSTNQRIYGGGPYVFEPGRNESRANETRAGLFLTSQNGPFWQHVWDVNYKPLGFSTCHKLMTSISHFVAVSENEG